MSFTLLFFTLWRLSQNKTCKIKFHKFPKKRDLFQGRGKFCRNKLRPFFLYSGRYDYETWIKHESSQLDSITIPTFLSYDPKVNIQLCCISLSEHSIRLRIFSTVYSERLILCSLTVGIYFTSVF